MAWVTFVLVVGWTFNTKEDFDTENLIYVYSKSLFIWIFETLILKGLFMCMNVGNPALLELFAYTGYKFVTLTPIIISEYFLGYLGSYVVMGMMWLCFGYFYFMTLKRFAQANTLAQHMVEVSMSKKTFMLSNCAGQCALIWLLSYN